MPLTLNQAARETGKKYIGYRLRPQNRQDERTARRQRPLGD